MVDGKVSEVGTYAELLSRRGAFSEFLLTYLETTPADDKSEIDDDGKVSL